MDELFTTYSKSVENKEFSLQYSCELPEEPIEMKTDENRIKQVLCNLLNNAIKFTYQGVIEFGYKIQTNFIEFYVKDTGIGLAPENLDLIFQRFRQVETKNAHEYGGNGLGLSISKALVEKLGGTIAVSSELGVGSTFTFTIPYEKVISKTTNPSETNSSIEEHHWQGKAILIVEDEVYNHTYIEELLLDSQAQLFHAWNGNEAVEQVKIHPDISLVLMDIKMPVMDGNEATRIIKQIRPHLPVIAQTAYALSHDKADALYAGFDDYISKPIPHKALLTLIAGYLN